MHGDQLTKLNLFKIFIELTIKKKKKKKKKKNIKIQKFKLNEIPLKINITERENKIDQVVLLICFSRAAPAIWNKLPRRFRTAIALHHIYCFIQSSHS